MYIKRHVEEVIRECLEQFPIVLVTGPRQIGKTTLLKNVCSEYKYVTLEDIFVLIEAIEETNLFLKNYQPPVFIDEVQYAPSIFRYLKMYVDTNKQKVSFALTGSQAFELMKGVSETLAGRMAIVELKGLSFREIHHVEFNKPFIPNETYFNERQSQIKSYGDLWYWIHRGSMPQLQDKKIDWQRYYSSYVKTYIERDVRQIINVSNELKFIKFLTSLAVRCSELLNINAVANEVETSADTIKRWLSILTYHSFPLRFKAHIGIKMCNELCIYFSFSICYHVLEVRSTLQSTVRRVADFCISFRLNQHLNQCKSEYFKHTLVSTSSP